MEKLIRLNSHAEAQVICGLHDENLKQLQKEYKVKCVLRGGFLKISGLLSRIEKASAAVDAYLASVRALPQGEAPERPLKYRNSSAPVSAGMYKPLAGVKAKAIGPKTKGQREYVDAIDQYDIVFGIGPAGTGKTYLAMASAVKALCSHQVRRIILTRPAIEAGESLGFLPGDMYEKISPYLRPLYDALYDMLEADVIEKYLETGIIEVAPLAYMRGRTLNDAFIIMDEAQNATAEQMKMFLTRLGFDSKAVITGDITQSDLPGSKPAGLLQACQLLKHIPEIKFIHLSGADVVRHALVQKVIEAYERTAKAEY